MKMKEKGEKEIIFRERFFLIYYLDYYNYFQILE